MGETPHRLRSGAFPAQRCVIWITTARDFDNQNAAPTGRSGRPACLKVCHGDRITAQKSSEGCLWSGYHLQRRRSLHAFAVDQILGRDLADRVHIYQIRSAGKRLAER